MIKISYFHVKSKYYSIFKKFAIGWSKRWGCNFHWNISWNFAKISMNSYRTTESIWPLRMPGIKFIKNPLHYLTTTPELPVKSSLWEPSNFNSPVLIQQLFSGEISSTGTPLEIPSQVRLRLPLHAYQDQLTTKPFTYHYTMIVWHFSTYLHD